MAFGAVQIEPAFGAARFASRGHIPGCEDTVRIVGRAGRGCSAEKELVGGGARSLIRLKHIIRKAVFGSELQVGDQNAVRVIDESELRFLWTSARTRDISRAIHTAHTRVTGSASHILVKAEWAWLRSYALAKGMAMG